MLTIRPNNDPGPLVGIKFQDHDDFYRFTDALKTMNLITYQHDVSFGTIDGFDYTALTLEEEFPGYYPE